MRILVIEDEISLNKTIIDNLNEFGYQTDSSENFKDGEYFIGIRHYDLVLASWNCLMAMVQNLSIQLSISLQELL